MLKKIIFIRHGENIYNSILDNNKLPLSNLGIAQAKFASNIINNQYDVIYCSNSLRAIQTADIINKNKKNIIIDKRLIEAGWGNNYDGNEPLDNINNRIMSFFRDVSMKHSYEKILIVTHGSLIRVAQSIIENSIISKERIFNCSLVIYNNRKNKIVIHIDIKNNKYRKKKYPISVSLDCCFK